MTPEDVLKRDSSAAHRDQVSDERDRHAVGRDIAAISRDIAVSERDARSRTDPGAAADRSAADSDRQSAAGDRGHAADDRAAAANDRSLAAEYSESILHDLLTGVYRRRRGLAELGRDIAKTRRTNDPFVLAFIDVDRLREANDLGGHEAGDRLLVRVAAEIRNVVREYDIVLRYGGDEFICGISGMDLAGATARFDRLNDALAASGGGSASVGVVQLEAGEDLTHLIARADAAMYERKRLRAGAARPTA